MVKIQNIFKIPIPGGFIGAGFLFLIDINSCF